jgi:hypothetical protein
MATEAVISTGRRRSAAPWRTASRIGKPWRLRSFKNETITMPFSMATPNTAMNPMAVFLDGGERGAGDVATQALLSGDLQSLRDARTPLPPPVGR